MSKAYIAYHQLEVYKLSRKLCSIGWTIYNGLDWKLQKIIGDQFIRSIDSVAANIAEGYGRFHYLDRAKFMYNSRGSLLEANHWIDLLYERKLINTKDYSLLIEHTEQIHIKLNSYISSIYNSKDNI